jgi:CAAX protease family protein
MREESICYTQDSRKRVLACPVDRVEFIVLASLTRVRCMEMSAATSHKQEPIAQWWHTVLVLLPLAIGSAASAHQHTLEHVNIPGLSFRLSAYLTVMVEEWSVVFLIWLALKHRGLSIAELVSGRWSRPLDFFKDLGLGIGFLVIVLPLMAVAGRLLPSSRGEVTFFPENWWEAIVWVFLGATAGFAEELIFRGYLTRQFHAWTNSGVLAVIIQGLLFGLAHGYYSSAMILIAAYGWLIGVLAWWRKSLRPGMLAHGLEDATLGLLTFFAHRR